MSRARSATLAGFAGLHSRARYSNPSFPVHEQFRRITRNGTSLPESNVIFAPLDLKTETVALGQIDVGRYRRFISESSTGWRSSILAPFGCAHNRFACHLQVHHRQHDCSVVRPCAIVQNSVRELTKGSPRAAPLGSARCMAPTWEPSFKRGGVAHRPGHQYPSSRRKTGRLKPSVVFFGAKEVVRRPRSGESPPIVPRAKIRRLLDKPPTHCRARPW
jgi:hypothetical protein